MPAGSRSERLSVSVGRRTRSAVSTLPVRWVTEIKREKQELDFVAFSDKKSSQFVANPELSDTPKSQPKYFGRTMPFFLHANNRCVEPLSLCVNQPFRSRIGGAAPPESADIGDPYPDLPPVHLQLRPPSPYTEVTHLPSPRRSVGPRITIRYQEVFIPVARWEPTLFLPASRPILNEPRPS